MTYCACNSCHKVTPRHTSSVGASVFCLVLGELTSSQFTYFLLMVGVPFSSFHSSNFLFGFSFLSFFFFQKKKQASKEQKAAVTNSSLFLLSCNRNFVRGGRARVICIIFPYAYPTSRNDVCCKSSHSNVKFSHQTFAQTT